MNLMSDFELRMIYVMGMAAGSIIIGEISYRQKMKQKREGKKE